MSAPAGYVVLSSAGKIAGDDDGPRLYDCEASAAMARDKLAAGVPPWVPGAGLTGVTYRVVAVHS